MRRISLFVFLMIFVLLGCSNANENQKELTYENLEETIQQENINECFSWELNTSDWSLLSSNTNPNGQITDVYSDGNYNYSVLRNAGIVYLISVSDEMIKSINDRLVDEPDSVITRIKADELLKEAVSFYFPEYNLLYLEIDCNETGNPLEYFSFTVCEYDGINRVNTAIISLAFDGTVTLVQGSHNANSIFDDSDSFSQTDIKKIVFEYMLKEKGNIEKTIISDEIYYDEFGNTMPPYYFLIEDENDLKDWELVKLVYNGTVCWCAEFTVQCSWMEIDEMYEGMNPTIQIYIDAKFGEIITYMTT